MVEVLGRSLVAGVGSKREQLRVIRVIARHRLVLNVAGRGLWGDLGGGGFYGFTERVVLQVCIQSIRNFL